MLNQQSLLIPVLISLAVIFATIFLHGLASVWGVKLLIRRVNATTSDLKLSTALYMLSFTAIFLMILHFIEIALWALVFMIIPEITELPTFDDAIYFAMITYTTVGYGDITLSTHWRIMSGFAAMDGIVLFGWSTAMLFIVVQRILLKVNPQNSDAK